MDPVKENLSPYPHGEAAEEGKDGSEDRGWKLFHHSGWVTYFTKRTERFFFFVLTIIMLLWGIAERFGLFGR
jgi:hypothetical protein